RVAFVLHDAFDLPFAEIAEALGCSVAAALQHASRGRRAAADADPPPRAALDEQREVLERFLRALSSGDLDAVVGLLHPDVVLVGDGGGKARTAVNVVSGPDNVARLVLGLLRRYGDALEGGRPVLVNGDLGLVFPAQGELTARVSAFVLRDGKVAGMYDVSNPDKLGHVPFPEAS
ncbi:MAG: SnoaL-like domain-containing protein, partial [Saccharothrix sp.]|nr:SnoaL-like domain-containing protein [Saccharothrix sp.]